VKIPRILVSQEEMAEDGITFGKKNSRYLRHVLRMKSGDLVQVVEGSHLHRVLLTVSPGEPTRGEILTTETGPTRDINIALAFCCVRPGPIEEILRHCTELGVSRFIPLISVRVNRKPQERKDRWTSIVASACTQSGRVEVPAVERPIRLQQFFLKDFGYETNLLLSTAANSRPLLELLPERPPGGVLILVGPEGGLEEAEEAQALEAGFHPVNLCRSILRTETAAVVSVGTVIAWYDSRHSTRQTVSPIDAQA